jgi:hypothetical protein
MSKRREIEIRVTPENIHEIFVKGDVIVEAEELGQVVSARMDVRGENARVYFMGGDVYVEDFGVPQTLRVSREVGLPEHEWSGRPIGTHVMVEISKAGGGTIGRRYAGDWQVRITQKGKVICEDVMRYAARSLTHEEAAREAYCFVDDAYAADHRD